LFAKKQEEDVHDLKSAAPSSSQKKKLKKNIVNETQRLQKNNQLWIIMVSVCALIFSKWIASVPFHFGIQTLHAVARKYPHNVNPACRMG
jgi:hypothetical protein